MDPKTISGKKILVAPLNWGLGHASRSAKLIQILKKKNQVTIASDGIALLWLKHEFPTINCLELPLLNMRYSRLFGASAGVLFRMKHFLSSINRDYKALKKIIKDGDFDLIISDNRYGIYNEEVESILLTHQLKIISPFSSLLDFPLQNFVEKFNEIWIPDTEAKKVSGELSTPDFKLRVPVNYIGLLSRFSLKTKLNIDYKFTLIASGLEPHRTQLIDYFTKNFSLLESKCCIVGGGKIEMENDKVELLEMPGTKDLEDLIDRSEYLICRSGYSSIMDLLIKNQKAVLIPTPGQPEQLYLADLHSDNSLFYSVLKENDLSRIMKNLC